eukprot:scaffold16051_cov111-Isochrysis_galbana.AAC.1
MDQISSRRARRTRCTLFVDTAVGVDRVFRAAAGASSRTCHMQALRKDSGGRMPKGRAGH